MKKKISLACVSALAMSMVLHAQCGVTDNLRVAAGTMVPFVSCGDPVGYHGYNYTTVQIGDQCWFAENLNYNPLNSDWEDRSFTEARTYALPESFANGTPQGARYNFIAVEQLELCPVGWHVPSREDIDVFENFLEITFPGGDEGLTIRNDSAWTIGTNETGFNAFPMPDYFQYGLGAGAHWWTTFSMGYPDAEGFYQQEPYTEFARWVQFSRDLRFGVRCLLDAE